MAGNDACLGSTSITGTHIEQAFREYVNDNSIKLVKVDAETIAAGQGFTSYILRLTLTWNDEDKKKHPNLPRSAIAKALSKESYEKLFDSFKFDFDTSTRQDFTQMIALGHKTECAVYEMFGKDGVKSPVPIAHAYATWGGDEARPPLIILEDLGDRARVLGDGSASLTYEQMLSAAEVQASLHAWCLTTDVQWKDKFPSFEDRLKLFAAMIPMMRQGLQQVKAAIPDPFGRIDDAKIAKLFEIEPMRQVHDEYKAWMPDVLMHGDFWANNVMYNKLPDGSMGNEIVALIDWQLPLVGNAFMDIGRMLSMSFDAHLRDDHLDDVMKYYYSSLQKKLGSRMPEKMTLERVIDMAHKQTAVSCLMLILMQETMQSLFAPGEGPEAEAKRERLMIRARGALDYADKVLDITIDQ